jgi:hypothetical protein
MVRESGHVRPRQATSGQGTSQGGWSREGIRVRVVVVGNSLDLLDREDGGKIDACDRIVRINSFRLDGYRECVGTRIDIVCLCLSTELVKSALVHSASLIVQARELWTPSWRGQLSDDAIQFAMRVVGRSPGDLVFCDDNGHKDVVLSLYEEVYREAEAREGVKTETTDGRVPNRASRAGTLP